MRRLSAQLRCLACGIEPRVGARFCDGCGPPLAPEHPLAEYKQVTVLFADVTRSMEIAASVGPERLREIMTELFDRATVVVQRCCTARSPTLPTVSEVTPRRTAGCSARSSRPVST